MAGKNEVGPPESRRQFRIQDRPPHYAVIDSVADVTGTDPTKLEPLADRIDPDALDVLVETTDEIEITFVWQGLVIRVDSTGWVVIEQW